MVKHRKEKRDNPNRFDKHFNHMGTVSVVLLIIAFVYILYYLYVVVSTGQDPTGSVVTSFTDLIIKLLQLFVGSN